MTQFEPTKRPLDALRRTVLSHHALLWVLVGIALIVMGWFGERLTIGTWPVAAPLLIGAGVATVVAAAVVVWKRPTRDTMAGWLLPRAALALLAVSVLLGVTPAPETSSEPPPPPESPASVCPQESADERELLHARLRGNTLACIYSSGGGQL